MSSDSIASDREQPIDNAILEEVARLYKVDKKSAARRLAAEEDAMEVYSRVTRADIPGYSGAWYDAETERLIVGTTVDDAVSLIQRLGAEARSMKRSLNDLESIRAAAEHEIDRDINSNGHLRFSYVDVIKNRVVFGVSEGRQAYAQQLFQQQPEIIVVSGPQAALTSGPLRGAMATRNFTWEQAHTGMFPPSYPCSTGVAVNGGYVTAGHCTLQRNIFANPEEHLSGTGAFLGYTRFSTMRDWGFFASRDIALVETVHGWTPTAEYEGFQQGVRSVPAAWSGTEAAAVGSTICRYGQTSGGPHCGTLSSRNAAAVFSGGWYVAGLLQVNGNCTSPGDSGGPHVSAATGQIQGLNTGGTTACGAATTSSDIVYAQPIQAGLDLINAHSGPPSRYVLTSHGAAAPTAQGLLCSPQGGATFYCEISSFSSQGPTSIAWQWSQGVASEAPWVIGSCVAGELTTVNLSLSNLHGSQVSSAYFMCHGGSPF